jgi:hypothetical protein
MRYSIVSFALLLLGFTTLVHADPFFNMWIVGRVAGSNGTFAGSVSALPGQSVEYQVWGQMAPIGTQNIQGTTTRTITSLLPYTGTVSHCDGVNSLFVDVWQDASDPVQADLQPVVLNDDPTPFADDSWDAGIGAGGMRSARTGAGGAINDLIGVRPIHGPGVFTDVDAEMIFSGTFSVPVAAPGPASLVRLRWYGTGTGGIHFSSGALAFITPTTEFGTDPYIGFIPAPLTSPSFSVSALPAGLSLTLAPEPGMLATSLAACVCLARRRRTNASI